MFFKVAQKVTQHLEYFRRKIGTNNFKKSPNLVKLIDGKRDTEKVGKGNINRNRKDRDNSDRLNAH